MCKTMFTKLCLLLLVSQLVACVSKPVFDTSQVNRSLTPQSVLAEPDSSLGDIAIWGGTILDIRNLEEVTQIEVLAYPLSSSDRPLLERPPLGRFIIRHTGFLEPTNFAQGRVLTALGEVGDKQQGSVGDSSYVYPVINAQALHLWTGESMLDRTSFHIGVGFGF